MGDAEIDRTGAVSSTRSRVRASSCPSKPCGPGRSTRKPVRDVVAVQIGRARPDPLTDRTRRRPLGRVERDVAREAHVGGERNGYAAGTPCSVDVSTPDMEQT